MIATRRTRFMGAILDLDMLDPSILEPSIKEDLSIAYVRAIAAKAGVSIQLFARDWGLDGSFQTVQRVQGGLITSGHPVDYQLKATELWEVRDGRVIYDLDIRAHNTLAERTIRHHSEGANACVLLLYCLPDDPEAWLHVTEDSLILKKCCYWHVIDATPSKHTSSVRVRIPVDHRFTPDALLYLLEEAAGAGRKYYGR